MHKKKKECKEQNRTYKGRGTRTYFHTWARSSLRRSYVDLFLSSLQVILIPELRSTESGHFLNERKMTILPKKTKKLKKMMTKKKTAKKAVGRKKKQKRKRKRNRNMDPSNSPQGKNALLLGILLLSKPGTLHLR